MGPDIPKKGKDVVCVGVEGLKLNDELLGTPTTKQSFLYSVLGLYGLLFLIIFMAMRVNYYEISVTSTLLFIFIIGVIQYVLAQAAHEASHFYVSTKGFLSPLLTWFLFYPFFLKKDFKISHSHHHAYFGDPEKDPDYSVYSRLPKSKIGFFYLIFKSLFGVSAVERFWELSTRPGKIKNSETGLIRKLKNGEAFPLFLTQTIIFLIFMAFQRPMFYFLFWVFPLISVVKTLVDLRLFAEHGGQSGKPALRSFLSDGLATRILGPYGFRIHAEHHLWPLIPYQNLPEVQKIVLQNNIPVKAELDFVEYWPGGHLSFIFDRFLKLPLLASKQ